MKLRRKKGTRCSGHCCKAFFLPYDPKELEEKREVIHDGDTIVDMVIPLGQGKALPGDKFPGDKFPMVVGGPEGHFYTCRHLEDGGDCAIYLRRPGMCRDYPYGGRCQYPGCTAPQVPRLGLIESEAEVVP